MSALICPICGCEAVESKELGTLFANFSGAILESDVLICHCPENHRFVTPSREYPVAADAQNKSGLVESKIASRSPPAPKPSD